MRFFFPAGRPTRRSATCGGCCARARRLRVALAGKPATLPCPAPPSRVEGAAIRATLVGHSTFLIQTQGVNLLTDPVWAERAGPFGVLGPKRATPPALSLDDCRRSTRSCLSHNHYDHMDLSTLARLAGCACPVWTPFGNDAILKRHDAGIDARALDWGEGARSGRCASRWSRRGTGRRAGAATGGWPYGARSCSPAPAARSISPATPAMATARCFPKSPRGPPSGWRCCRSAPMRRAGSCKTSIATPKRPWRSSRALGPERAVACHWGTFRLTDEPYDEPPRRLAAALAQAGIAADRFVAPPPGGVVEIA